MAKMYYNSEEAMAKLGCSESELRTWVREGRLREFRDAGKLNYRVEEVDKLAAGPRPADSSGDMLSLADTGELKLAPADSDAGGGDAARLLGSGSAAGLGGSDAPIDLGASDSGLLQLEDEGGDKAKPGEGSGGGKPADSGGSDLGLSGSGSGVVDLSEDSGGSGAVAVGDKSADSGGDILSLDEVDKDAAKGMRKDDTVITNIGISVFDDDDLEIAADPMAKTLLTGGDEHLGLDGSGGGSGLLDLTRESDDTSLGAELLEGIDMGDTAETLAPTTAGEQVSQVVTTTEPMAEPGMEPAMAVARTQVVGLIEPASAAFTGLLIAAAVSLALAGAMNVATSMGAWPRYLQLLADRFWLFLGGTVGLGALCSGIGYAVGRQASSPRPPREKKPKADKAKDKKGKKAQPQAEKEQSPLGEEEPG